MGMHGQEETEFLPTRLAGKRGYGRSIASVWFRPFPDISSLKALRSADNASRDQNSAHLVAGNIQTKLGECRYPAYFRRNTRAVLDQCAVAEFSQGTDPVIAESAMRHVSYNIA